jgi:hypothetical protein
MFIYDYLTLNYYILIELRGKPVTLTRNDLLWTIIFPQKHVKTKVSIIIILKMNNFVVIMTLNVV